MNVLCLNVCRLCVPNIMSLLIQCCLLWWFKFGINQPIYWLTCIICINHAISLLAWLMQIIQVDTKFKSVCHSSDDELSATYVSSSKKWTHGRLQVLILLNATLCAACLQTFNQPHNNQCTAKLWLTTDAPILACPCYLHIKPSF